MYEKLIKKKDVCVLIAGLKDVLSFLIECDKCLHCIYIYNANHDLNRPLVQLKSSFIFFVRKSQNLLSSIAYNSQLHQTNKDTCIIA